MRRNPRRLALWTVSIFCVLLLAACNNSPGVKSISIIPATQTISATTTQQFTATVNYTDGATKPGAGLVAWSSGTTSVATIDPASGVATGVAAGTSTITATYKGGSGTATLSVNQLLSIAVTPMFAVIPGATSTQQFTAMGTFKNPDGTTGNPQDITGMVTWASSTAGVATINNSGLATAVGTGVTSISDSLFGVTSPSVDLTVGAPVPIGLQITPALPTTAVGNTVPFTAMELLSDGTSTQPLSGSVTWSSATTTAASIGANNGIALGVGTGSSVITATESGTACPGPAACVGTTTVTVVPAVSRFAYVGDLNDNSSTAIAEFSVDVANANLNPLNPASVGGKFPQQLVVHPSGKFIYEIDDTNALQVYDFSSGQLALANPPPPGSPYQAGNSGAGKAIFDPTGQFLYVVNSQALSSPVDGVYGFTVNQSTGALTAIGTAGVPLLSDASSPALSTPVDVLMDHQGKYLYVVNSGNSTINAYSIEANGGLTALSSPTVSTGATPNFGTIDPSNTHLYVANTGDNSVTVLKINPDGTLSPGGTATTVTGATHLFNVIVDPTGKYLYALDSAVTAGNNLYAYLLNPDGTLPAVAATSYPTGAGPWGMSIDASGTVLAVVNNLDSPTATVSLFSLAAGILKPTATVTTATWMNPEYLTFYNAP